MEIKHAKWHWVQHIHTHANTHTHTHTFPLNSLPYDLHGVCVYDLMPEGRNCRGAQWCRVQTLFKMNIKESEITIPHHSTPATHSTLANHILLARGKKWIRGVR